MRLPYPVPGEFLEQASLGPDWAAFFHDLPRTVDAITDEWRLTFDGEPSSGYTGLVMPVLTEDGRRAMLKVGYVDAESSGEPLALQLWGGRGAVALWAADPRRGATLMERIGPDDLHTVEVIEACEVVSGLYGLLHRPPTPRLTDIRDLAAGWLERIRQLPRDGMPSRFVEQALAAAPRLFAMEPTAVVHGDLHYANVLRGSDGEWVAIDPKGLAGSPEYEVTPMLMNRWDEIGEDPGAGVRERFYTLVDGSQLDERRARDWVVLRSVLNVSWEYAAAAGQPFDAAHRDWVTRAITVAKAMQAI